LLTLSKFVSPSLLVFVQLFQSMLADFEQADPVQGFSTNPEGIVPLLIFSLQSLLVPGI